MGAGGYAKQQQQRVGRHLAWHQASLGFLVGQQESEVGGGKRRGREGNTDFSSRQKVNCASSQCQPVLGP